MLDFWAKTTKDGKPGISVYEHMLNVGCVARCVAEMLPEILELFHLRSKEVGALAGLHDLGKISPGFQRKCGVWLEEHGLSKIALNGRWDAMESNHGAVSHSALQDFLISAGMSRNSAQYLSAALGAHHGRLRRPNPRGIRPHFEIGEITENSSGIRWDQERQTNAEKVWRYFNAECSTNGITGESPVLWWLAGLASVADWIGSDERFFPPGRVEVPGDPASLALSALSAIGFHTAELIPDLTFHELFHDPENPELRWFPNDMQEKTVATVTGPGVYVIEAPMGMGKTEAALWAAYRLLLCRKATGIYFALPTQVTSNRVHLRMNQFLRRISAETSARLVHGNSWLFETHSPIHPTATGVLEKAPEDARACQDWFDSSKRALLAPFGVGTIDQALLGVVAAKHFFVRHFALAGKVVILDELHSYDVYTGTLIDKLIAALDGLGCTVIVLSATLTRKRREVVVPNPGDARDYIEPPYPLITGRRQGVVFEPVPVSPPKSRQVRVNFVSSGEAEAQAVSLARRGGAVLWICDTVDAAQRQYKRFRDPALHHDLAIGLLHSRFPFWRREQLENDWMERLGKDRKTRYGCILISTQIVEQSVDLDADLMITELAPTDMLLQRLGRLWRHERENRPADFATLLVLDEEKDLDELRRMKPAAIKAVLGNKANVYDPFVLLRSLEVWQQQCRDKGAVWIPSEIRRLLESTYECRDIEPDPWLELADECFAKRSAMRMLASQSSNIWQLPLEDDEGVQTRVNEMPTIAVVLCREQTARYALFLDDSESALCDGGYRLATAQAIHRNLVKVPEHCFDLDRLAAGAAFSDYLHGVHCVGILREDGAVEVRGLRSSLRLFYCDDLGLAIDKDAK